MQERKTYVGTLKGVKGIWCDKKPRGLEVEKTITWYSADEGKVFVDKEGNMVDSVVIDENTKIEDFVEIVKPKIEEDANEEQ